MRRALVTGATGQVGAALARAAWPEGWEVVPLTRAALDLAKPDAIAVQIAALRPALVINAAAYTAVDQAEREPAAAWTANATAVAALAAAAQSADAPLVHLSTDYVFDGGGDQPHRPDDACAPLNVYGASKLGGEWAVRTSGARHAIVRTSWVVSAAGRNFVNTMLRLAETHPTVRVVADQHGAPSFAPDLAAALIEIGVRLANGAPSGTWHWCNAGETSWAGFAAEIFRQSARRGGPTAQVEPIATTDYPTPARRPHNSRLDCSATERDFGLQRRPWQDALADLLDERLGCAG